MPFYRLTTWVADEDTGNFMQNSVELIDAEADAIKELVANRTLNTDDTTRFTLEPFNTIEPTASED